MKKQTKHLGVMMLALAAMEAANGKRRIYDYQEQRQPRELTAEEKAKRHLEFGADQTMHAYNINGIIIKATSKKVAKKIYNRMKK